MRKKDQGTILCGKCGLEPADPRCAVRVSAFGVGEVTVYLCRGDYARLLQDAQRAQAEVAERQQRRSDFENALREAEKLALQVYGGRWSDRETLAEQLRREEDLHGEARKQYRDADDATPAGQLARIRVIRLAALCLASALGIEAIKAGDAVSGTLTRVTSAFHKKGGLTIPIKEITREQVITALLTLLHYRETHPENEEEEIQLLLTEGESGTC